MLRALFLAMASAATGAPLPHDQAATMQVEGFDTIEAVKAKKEGIPARQPCDAACKSHLPRLSYFEEEYLQLIADSLTGMLTLSAGSCDLGRSTGPNGCDLDKTRPVDLHKRANGEDWPPFGKTMVGLTRLGNFRSAIEHVIAHNISGDIAEFGVWRGGACIYAEKVLQLYGQDTRRKVLVFDAFERMAKYAPLGRSNGKNLVKYLATTESTVRASFEEYKALGTNVEIHKGFFADTAPAFNAASAADRRVAVLRVDGNFYSSYRAVMYAMYERVPVGGVVIFDDIMSHPNVMRFWKDFVGAYNLSEELIRIDKHSTWFVKQREVRLDQSRLADATPD